LAGHFGLEYALNNPSKPESGAPIALPCNIPGAFERLVDLEWGDASVAAMCLDLLFAGQSSGCSAR
jgi:hypothetical protein